jgi:uncharacterized protein YbcI
MDHMPGIRIGFEERRGLELEDLTNAMVRLYKEQFGRGPTKARSDYAGPNALLVTVENSLRAGGAEHDRPGRAPAGARDPHVLSAREHDEFIGTVEEITGRKVRAFVSGIDTGHDVSSEVLLLRTCAGCLAGCAAHRRVNRISVSKGGVQFPGRAGTGFPGPAGTGTGAAPSGTDNRSLP